VCTGCRAHFICLIKGAFVGEKNFDDIKYGLTQLSIKQLLLQDISHVM
jgi:hypothetical protein